MTQLTLLWLPILLGAVFVFVASSIIHMGPFWHRGEYPQVPDEPKARAAIGALNIPPGDYMLPGCKNPSEMNTPEFKQKMTEGPVMILTVRPNGQWGMSKALLQWFMESRYTPKRRDMTISLFGPGTKLVRSWVFMNAYPVKWTGGDLNASSTEILTESLEIAHSGMAITAVAA